MAIKNYIDYMNGKLLLLDVIDENIIEMKKNKGQPDGYAPLDSDAEVPHLHIDELVYKDSGTLDITNLIIDNGDGSINIESAIIAFYKNPNSVGKMFKGEIPPKTGLVPQDGKTSYIKARWTGSALEYFMDLNQSDANASNVLIIGTVLRASTRLYITQWSGLANGKADKINARIANVNKYEKELEGLIVSLTPTYQMEMTAGVIYGASKKFDMPSYSSSTLQSYDTYVYNASGEWVSTSFTDIVPVGAYNARTGLPVQAPANKYTIGLIYRYIGTDKHYATIILDEHTFDTVADARNHAKETGLPDFTKDQHMYMGRIIAKGDKSDIHIDRVTNISYDTAPVSSHGSLSGVQGNGQLHLNATELNHYNDAYLHSQSTHAPSDAYSKTDADAITTRIDGDITALANSIATPVHNLVTDSAVAPLSAGMGKKLQDEKAAKNGDKTEDFNVSDGSFYGNSSTQAVRISKDKIICTLDDGTPLNLAFNSSKTIIAKYNGTFYAYRVETKELQSSVYSLTKGFLFKEDSQCDTLDLRKSLTTEAVALDKIGIFDDKIVLSDTLKIRFADSITISSNNMDVWDIGLEKEVNLSVNDELYCKYNDEGQEKYYTATVTVVNDSKSYRILADTNNGGPADGHILYRISGTQVVLDSSNDNISVTDNGAVNTRIGDFKNIFTPDFGPLSGIGIYSTNIQGKGNMILGNKSSIDVSGVKNLKVGGRNYILNSSLTKAASNITLGSFGTFVSDGIELVNIPHHSVDPGYLQINSKSVDPDDYILSFDIKSLVPDSIKLDTDGVLNCDQVINTSTDWERKVIKCTSTTSGEVYIKFYSDTIVSLWSGTIRNIKLEKATVASDWFPAPEDTPKVTTQVLKDNGVTVGGSGVPFADDVLIGGTNLAPKQWYGSYRGGSWYPEAYGTVTSGYKRTTVSTPNDLVGFKCNVEEGDITVSGKTDLTTVQVWYTCYDLASGVTQAQRTEIVSASNGRFIAHLSVPSGTVSLHAGVGYHPWTSEYWIEEVKFEKGLVASDWSPALEDAALNSVLKTTERVDLTSLDDSKYYPVTIGMSSTTPYTILIERPLGPSYGVPDHSEHSNGFSCMLKWTSNGSGWGSSTIRRSVETAMQKFSSVDVFGNLSQLVNQSLEYVYLRGGSKYNVEVVGTATASIVLRPTTDVYSGQTLPAPIDSVTYPIERLKYVNSLGLYKGEAILGGFDVSDKTIRRSGGGTISSTGRLGHVSMCSETTDYGPGLYFDTGQRTVQGFSVGSDTNGTAYNIVIGQMMQNRDNIKTNYYGIQMMDHTAKNYFRAGFNAETGDSWCGIADWKFDSNTLWTGTWGQASSGYTTNTDCIIFKAGDMRTKHTKIVDGILYTENAQIHADSITCSSHITATDYKLSSDRRLKEGVVPLDFSNSEEIRAVNYNFKADESKKLRVGYIAQEVEKLHPYLVSKGSNGMLAVDYTGVHTLKIAKLEHEVRELKKLLKGGSDGSTK